MQKGLMFYDIILVVTLQYYWRILSL